MFECGNNRMLSMTGDFIFGRPAMEGWGCFRLHIHANDVSGHYEGPRSEVDTTNHR